MRIEIIVTTRIDHGSANRRLHFKWYGMRISELKVRSNGSGRSFLVVSPRTGVVDGERSEYERLEFDHYRDTSQSVATSFRFCFNKILTNNIGSLSLNNPVLWRRCIVVRCTYASLFVFRVQPIFSGTHGKITYQHRAITRDTAPGHQ